VQQDVFRPLGPYSLRLSARSDTYGTALPGGGRGEAWQRRDGSVVLRARDEAGLRLLRFMLALEDDHAEFVRRFRSDPLLGRSIRELHGLRPLRLSTVTQAVVRAICGQLIQARRARAIEGAILRACGTEVPTREAVGALSPAQLRRLGLATARASTLVRLCRSLELERLRDLPAEAVETRLLRERGIGPWSLGVIGLQGLGSYRYGLVGDLSLVKLCSSLRGRWVEGWETAELLEPYGEWAGLAGVYLMRGWTAGLIPGASADRARLIRVESRRAA
jgi:3-methyladenine DNA glycosylase/8-oxoguanine DNA glycosylase